MVLSLPWRPSATCVPRPEPGESRPESYSGRLSRIHDFHYLRPNKKKAARDKRHICSVSELPGTGQATSCAILHHAFYFHLKGGAFRYNPCQKDGLAALLVLRAYLFCWLCPEILCLRTTRVTLSGKSCGRSMMGDRMKNFETTTAIPWSELYFSHQNLRYINAPWKEVLHIGKERVYKKNSIIPDSATFSYIISGVVQSVYAAQDGRERIVIQFMESCLFGIPNAFIRRPDINIPNDIDRLSFFRCSTDVRLIEFPIAILHDDEFIRAHPSLISNAMATLSLTIIVFFNALTALQMNDIQGKLANFILGVMKKNNNSCELQPSITQHELACLLGVHRGSLARALKQLRDAGIISGFTKNKLTVLDVTALKKLSRR